MNLNPLRRKEQAARDIIRDREVHYDYMAAVWFVDNTGERRRETLRGLTPAARRLARRGELEFDELVDRVSPDGSTFYATQRVRLAEAER